MAAPHHPDSLAGCLAFHDELATLLRAHQCHIVQRRADVARSSFHAFASRLEQHLSAEESVLIPVFQARCTPQPRGCSTELLLAEHAKLRRLSEQARETLTNTKGDASQTWAPGQALDLIEAERSLREVLDHHDQREREAFFPTLAATLSADEWSDLRRAFQQAHETNSTSG